MFIYILHHEQHMMIIFCDDNSKNVTIFLQMLLNSTFIYLTLHGINKAPIFSQHNSKYFSTLKLNSCYFSNFSQYVLFSISSKSKISVSSSSFNQGLSQAIYISSTERITGETSDINLYLCKFQNINVPNDSGGAIFSTYSVSLDSCIFYNLRAKTGGAFSICSNLNVQNTDFQNISAAYYGFAEISPNSPSIVIERSIVNNINTQSTSGFRRHDGFETRLTYTNYTNLRTSSMVSLGEFGRTPNAIFSFNYVADCLASEKNGALSFWQCENFLCSDILFLNITVGNPDVSHANGIVVWLDGSLQTGKFIRCAFFKCQTIYKGHGSLLYAEASSKITVSDCQFEERKEKVFNSNSNVYLIDDSNKFSVEKIQFKGKLAKNVIQVQNENSNQKINIFPLGQFFYMCSFLSFVVFVIMLDKYA